MAPEDAKAVRGLGKVIAINNTVQLAPWADVLYSCDPSWWMTYPELWEDFAGRRVGLDHPLMPDGIERLKYANAPGLGKDQIHTGHNSGYQAINYAYLHGARTIVLLGYDMSGAGKHWHEPHPRSIGNFLCPDLCAKAFPQLAADLSSQGVRIINASRQSALLCFERRPLLEVLALLN